MATTSTEQGIDREQLILDNLPLVRFVAKTLQRNFYSGGVDFDDLVGYGTLGLVQAAERFDPEQGGKFSSFAMSRIRGAILDGLRTVDPVGRVSRRMSRRIESSANTLALELGREPTAEEIQCAAGVSSAAFWNIRRLTAITQVSIDHSSEDDGDWPVAIADDRVDVSAVIERRELRIALANAIAALPERERMILGLYYGEKLSMKEVARVLTISETRVSQLLNRAYSLLRRNPELTDAA